MIMLIFECHIGEYNPCVLTVYESFQQKNMTVITS